MNRLVMLAGLSLLFCPMLAHGQYSLVFDQSNVVMGVGSTTTLNLYLTQTGVGVTGSYLSSPGIVSVGVMLAYQAPAGTASRVINTSDIVPNSAFDFIVEQSVTNIRDGNVTRLQEAVFINPTVVAPTSGPNANRILVGSFTITAGSLGSVTTIRLLDPNNPPPSVMNPLFSNTVTDLLPNSTTVALDQFNATTPLYPLSTATTNYLDLATITVAVPEPTTIAFIVCCALAGAAIIWRRVRQQARAENQLIACEDDVEACVD